MNWFVQGPMHNQLIVAEALGLPAHKVVAKTKRIGGGFGGKETRALPLTGAACIPAWKLRRPVRLIQDRDEDMHTSGHRHAFIGKYKVHTASLSDLHRGFPRLRWQTSCSCGQGVSLRLGCARS